MRRRQPRIGAARRAFAIAAMVAACCSIAVHGADATVFGIADAPGQFARCASALEAQTAPCPGPLAGYWNEQSFTALGSPGSAHPLTMIRVAVAYDAVWASDNSGRCQASNPWQYGYTSADGTYPAGYAWNALYDELQAIHADGYTPLVVITGYGPTDAIRTYTGSVATGDPAQPDPTTVSGSEAFRCGVAGILNEIDATLPVADWPHAWEAWNEPDGGCTYVNRDLAAISNPCVQAACAALNVSYPCSATGSGDASCAEEADTGAAKAACLAVIADRVLTTTPDHQSDVLVEGALSWPSPGYVKSYYHLLSAQRPSMILPNWSVHDYGDTTASAYLGSDQTAQLARFDAVLDALGCSGCNIWVTESAVNELDPSPTYNGTPASCAVGTTLGECVDGSPAAQTAGADGFFTLATVGPLPVTHLFWYEWQAPAVGGWDSGMVDTGASARTPYCVWIGADPDDCDGSPWPEATSVETSPAVDAEDFASVVWNSIDSTLLSGLSDRLQLGG